MTTLNGTLPELQQAFAALSSFGSVHGMTIGVADYGGFRTAADTTEILNDRVNDFNVAVRNGSVPADTSLSAFRPIAPYGRSYHDYGAAFDVLIVARPAGMTDAQAKRQLGSYAPTIGLRWGGGFTNPDPSHFELAISLSEAASRYQAMQGGGGGNVGGDVSAFDSGDPTAFVNDLGGGTVDDGSGGAVDDGSSGFSTDGLVILGVLIVGAMLFATRYGR